MKTTGKIQRELWFKEQRVSFWERYHSIPTTFDVFGGDLR